MPFHDHFLIRHKTVSQAARKKVSRALKSGDWLSSNHEIWLEKCSNPLAGLKSNRLVLEYRRHFQICFHSSMLSKSKQRYAAVIDRWSRRVLFSQSPCHRTDAKFRLDGAFVTAFNHQFFSKSAQSFANHRSWKRYTIGVEEFTSNLIRALPPNFLRWLLLHRHVSEIWLVTRT